MGVCASEFLIISLHLIIVIKGRFTGMYLFTASRFFKKDHVAILNEKVKLKCEKEKVVKWKWFFNDETLPSHVIIDEPYKLYESSVSIEKAQFNNTGKYECFGFKDNSMNFSAQYNLLVYGM